MPTIHIRKSETYRSRIEDVTDKNLFFYTVYKQAQECVKTIVADTRKFRKSEQLSSNSHPRNSHISEINPLSLKGYPNNIIAFCAKRGHGKTSAMISFSNALSRINCDQDSNQATHEHFWDESIRNCHFLVLDSIDPTALESTDSVIRTIISRMFQQFSAKSITSNQNYVNYQNHESRELQQTLLQQFQRCYQLSDVQKETDYHNDDYDDLQKLTELGDSSNFKSELASLVDQHLRFMFSDELATYRTNNASSFLVIQIDDTDMNTTNAYEVVEDLRKYCVLPNVIILLATDMSLLEQIVEHYFVKSFDTIIYGGIDGDRVSKHTALLSRERCHKTATNYLEKLIPGLHRINLPDIDAELRNSKQKVYLQLDLDGTEYSQELEPSYQQSPDIQEYEYQKVLSKLLMQKCLFELDSSGSELHPFFPKRMRELGHFVAMLQSMEDVNCTIHQLLLWAAGGGDDAECRSSVHTLKSNQAILMDYFLNRWCEIRLDHRERTVMADIHEAAPEKKILVAIVSLNRLFPEDEELALHKLGNGWSELLRCTNYLAECQKRNFACALELYFHLFKDMLMIYDCEDRANRRRENAK